MGSQGTAELVENCVVFEDLNGEYIILLWKENGAELDGDIIEFSNTFRATRGDEDDRDVIVLGVEYAIGVSEASPDWLARPLDPTCPDYPLWIIHDAHSRPPTHSTPN